MVELRHRRQGPKESLQELAQAVRELTARAYPEIQEGPRERLARNHFHDAIASPTVREGVYRARPQNLDEAVQAALETENYEKIERQRAMDMKPMKFARGLETAGDDRMGKLELPISEQCQAVDKMESTVDRLKAELSQQGHRLDTILAKLNESSKQAVEVAQAPRGVPKSQGGGRAQWKCFNCGGKGHFARNCKRAAKERSQPGNGSQPNEGPAGRLVIPQGPK